MSIQQEKIKELVERRAIAKMGGGQERIDAQHQKGKLTARERLALLLDEGSFEEFDMFVQHRCANFGMETVKYDGDGVVTGMGTVDGRLVYVYSQDFTVTGGTMSETMARKICKVADMAIRNGAPLLCLNDSGGARIQEGMGGLAGLGEIFTRHITASGVIPQITAVFGNCGGGLGVMSGLSDYTLVEENNGKLFINSPNTIEGNSADKCDTSSAKFQYEAGNADYIADEAGVINRIRDIVTILPANNEDIAEADCEDDINRVCAELANCVGDTAIAASQISDDGVFFETKADYAKEMVTGFIKLNGATVGAVANRTEVYVDGAVAEKFDAVLTANGCDKAADFINFCDAFQIPVLSLTNVKGFKATKCSEKRIAKAVARLTYAFANATVPKVNVVIGKALGSAYVAMNSKAIGADITMAWPNAEIGAMEASLAAKILCDGQGAEKIAECKEAYAALQNNVNSAAARGYVDQIVAPQDTRKYVIGAFEMLFTKREDRPVKKHGTV